MRKVMSLLMVGAAFAAADPAVHAVGVGARACGMAGNFTALADDFSALFWNPAGLAFVQAREAHCGFDLDRQDAETDLGGRSTPAFAQRVRISSAGLMRSVPTVWGGFGFAIGFSSPWLLDDINNFNGTDIYKGGTGLAGGLDTLFAGDTLFRDKDNHASTGQCNLWSAGMGWQIAPGLGFGFSVGLLTGSQLIKKTSVSHTRQAAFENYGNSFDREYFGYDARIGFLYTPAAHLFVGCRLELPRRAKVAENASSVDNLWPGNDTAATSFGTLQSGFSGALGSALHLPYMTVSGDVTFRSPVGNAASGSSEAHWKGGVGTAIEVPVRFLAGVARCGYTYSGFDLSSMLIRWDAGSVESPEPLTVLRNQHLVTAGFSFFLGSNVSVELAYGCSFWKFSTRDPAWQSDITERHVLQRGMTSLSIRY
jgi:hypothetical protein